MCRQKVYLMKQDFYFFRHGETDYNVEKRVQGWQDIPLNSNGIAQAHELANKLSNVKFDCIYSSPLSRALKTAQIVCEKSPTKIILEDGLKERNLGVFSGKIVRMNEASPDTPIDYSTDIVYVPLDLLTSDDFVPENGESYNMLAKRVYDTMMKITKNTDAKTIGIATHGGFIKSLIKQFTNFTYPRNGIPNAEYIKIQWDGNKFTVHEPPAWLIACNPTDGSL